MTNAADKDIVAQFYDLVWIKRDMEKARKIISPDCVRHDPSGPVPTGPDGFAATVDKWRASFSDFALAIDFMLAESPLVAARWTITATHTAPFAGVSASYKRIKFSGANIFRIESGRVAEIWNHRDDLSVMQQIGAIPQR